MEVAIEWGFLAVVAARIGCGGVDWFLVSSVLSPLTAILLWLALGRLRADDLEAPTSETDVCCPPCRERARYKPRGVALVPVFS
jgi:hypothetical protein